MNGWNFHYPPPVFQAVWDAFGQAMDDGDCVAPSEVLVELSKRSGDPLHTWAKGHQTAFLPPLASWQPHLTAIQAFAPHWFSGTGKHDADPFVVAMAMDLGLPVVTYEGRAFSGSPASVATVKRSMIVVCAQFHVPVMLPGDVLVQLGTTL